MKGLLLLAFLISYSLVKGQAACTLTNNPPTEIFYPNTINTPTTTGGIQYLCGPNTVVYDTLFNGCAPIVFMTNNTTLYLKHNCSNIFSVWMKGTCTLNILPGSSGAVGIGLDGAAIINNYSSVPTYTTLCTNIVYTTVNCGVGINELTKRKSIFQTYPNPSSTKINIELLNSDTQTADVRIINQIGEIVLEKKQWAIADKEIPIDNLSNGWYFIQVKTKQGLQTEKLIINR